VRERGRGVLPPELRLVSHSSCSAEDVTGELARLDRMAAAIQRGLRWILAMQNDDGGWAAFDQNNNHQFLCHVPFADHNAMIDPSSVDITGAVLECLGKMGRRRGDPVVDRGVKFIRGQQQPDGSWFGRWGVNYIYGTWKALLGITEVGVPGDDPAVAAGANWLLSCQQPCGGWGESPDSYFRPQLRGQGPPTASQTAWAIMGLSAAGLQEHPAVSRGVQYLVKSQSAGGRWEESEFTGTGFPQVFYLRYHYYPIYFPLMALAQWGVKVERLLSSDEAPQLRLAGEDG
jgi:squalene-hopene/tetraprenyl-beta-curcumene cyclase